ncbi:hypothetical protein [Cupriavidus sp. RAF12]|uniref:hypothetical protein n=1 Tax=Cupriavidus sp. RAF12 TaxID=3233050 RepID=UPI003F91A97B
MQTFDAPWCGTSRIALRFAAAGGHCLAIDLFSGSHGVEHVVTPDETVMERRSDMKQDDREQQEWRWWCAA